MMDQDKKEKFTKLVIELAEYIENIDGYGMDYEANTALNSIFTSLSNLNYIEYPKKSLQDWYSIYRDHLSFLVDSNVDKAIIDFKNSEFDEPVPIGIESLISDSDDISSKMEISTKKVVKVPPLEKVYVDTAALIICPERHLAIATAHPSFLGPNTHIQIDPVIIRPNKETRLKVPVFNTHRHNTLIIPKDKPLVVLDVISSKIPEGFRIRLSNL
tara:strand:+ start:51 stop:695 length:645 start_codon:yes stop_codon:yes gene_type:complete